VSADALAQAFAHLESGRLTEARRLARGLEQARPEPAALPYLLGLIALAEGQGKKAAQQLARACARTPGAIPPLLAFARSQTLQDRQAEAKSAYRRLLALAPDLAIGWQELAELQLRADLKLAFKPLRAATRLLPGHAGLRSNLGIAARANGDVMTADANFLAAILLDPSLAKPYANRAALLRHRHLPAEAEARRAFRISPDAASHIELGQALDPASALDHFAEAARLLPSQLEPLWLQAEALRQLDRKEQAATLYRQILDRDPEDRFGAGLALAGLVGAIPERAAKAHVEALYDQYAVSFEQNLLGELAYRGPQIIMDGLKRLGLTGPFDVYDAGCGTGLMGQAIKQLAKRLIGVDLSAKMADLARARGIYDEVRVGDLLAMERAAYDLVLAADVLIYLGDLHQVSRAASEALRPSGAFAFTVERSEEDAVVLLPSGRFAHSEDHLRQTAKAAGLQVALLEPTTTRREKDLPVPGLLCILRKQ